MMMDGSTKRLLGCSLAMMLLPLPFFGPALAQSSAPATGVDAGADGPIYCRPPQQRTDSIMMGPKVCLPVAKWKQLHDNNQDVSADGKTIVPTRSDESVFSGRQ
jgi:hypothetical protein